MTTPARLLVLLMAVLFVMVPVAAQASSTVLAFTAEAEDEEAPVETTFAPGEEPAVVTPPTEAEERDIPWTGRYLAPVLLLGGVLVAIAYFVFYGARVRGKYEVVD